MVDEVRLLIGTITSEYARRADFYDYREIVEKPSNTMMMSPHDASPAKGRNSIVEVALEYNRTHILFLDDDMAFPADSIKRLLAHNLDIVSGLYFSRVYPHQPLMFDMYDDKGHAFFSYMEPDVTGLKQVAAVGAGFLLAKVDIFKKLEKPYFRLGELDPQEWCDDIGFFWRLQKAGISLYCDTDCRVGHIGTYIARPDYIEGQWVTVYDTGGKGSTATAQIHAGLKYDPATGKVNGILKSVG